MTRDEVRVSAAFECLALDMAEVSLTIRLARETVDMMVAAMACERIRRRGRLSIKSVG